MKKIKFAAFALVYCTLFAVMTSIGCNNQPASTTNTKQEAPKMKMTTAIPPQITTPDSVDTRIGTLKFSHGFPDDAMVKKVYDNLDFKPWFDNKTWKPGEFELVNGHRRL